MGLHRDIALLEHFLFFCSTSLYFSPPSFFKKGKGSLNRNYSKGINSNQRGYFFSCIDFLSSSIRFVISANSASKSFLKSSNALASSLGSIG
jgi:hypothetical protein